ncbi:monooxygenase [Apiospora arundinis]
MRFSSLVLSASLGAAATIIRQADNGCTNPTKRVEWRTMTPEVQKQYVNAVLCLKTKPSGMGLNTSRYDDFPYVHTNLDKTIHSVAMFLPWHRLFVQVYEESLRNCGYTGPMAYWDWTLDTADVSKAPVWDAVMAFGGNGNPAIDPMGRDTSKKCLVDGPLKNFEVAYTMKGLNPHCLTRNWNSGIEAPGNMLADAYTKEVIDGISALSNYKDFRYKLEGGPHGAIHSAVGGDMSPATSPNDPIFFLHHAQIDRLWTQWQQENPRRKEPGEASLKDVMPYLDLVPDIKVSEVMSTQTSRICYTY